MSRFYFVFAVFFLGLVSIAGAHGPEELPEAVIIAELQSRIMEDYGIEVKRESIGELTVQHGDDPNCDEQVAAPVSYLKDGLTRTELCVVCLRQENATWSAHESYCVE